MPRYPLHQLRLAPFLLALCASLAGQDLIDSDFGAAGAPATTRGGQASTMVTGPLPSGWNEDSSGWCTVAARTRPVDDEGRTLLRVDVERVVDGAFQLCHAPLPERSGDGPTFYRLRAAIRNHGPGSLTLGLREVGPPYRYAWQQQVPASGTLTVIEQEIRLEPEAPTTLGLWITTREPGSFELGRVTLQHYSREALLATLRARYPDGGPAQLLPQNRLPLGLASGWMLDRHSSDGDVVTVTGDATTPGPSGAPSLHLAAPEATRLVSAPFHVVNPAEPHRARLAVRGSGAWQLEVRADDRIIAQRDLTPGDTWSTAALAFEPVLMTKAYNLVLAGSGELWFDDLRAGPDRSVDAVAPRPEVALALADGEADEARIVFADEALAVRYLATLAPAGAQLRATVTDLYGRTTALDPIALDPAGGTIALGEVVGDGLGAFRLEAAIARDGRDLSPVAELVVNRLPRPRHWGEDAPDSPFGVHTLSTTRHLLMAKAVGINWTRLHDAGLEYVGWWNLEPQPGEWRFFDREIHRYRDHHVRIFGELGTAPRWASHYPEDKRRGVFGYYDKFFQPRDLADYRHYVRTVTERYAGVIDAWDVWNEPWIHRWWAVDFDPEVQRERGFKAAFITSAEPQKDFVALMATAHDTVEAIDPAITVAGFNTTAGEGSSATRFSGADWTDGVLAHGGLDHCDVLAYHQYTGDAVGHPGDSVERGLDHALGATRRADGTLPKPAWMTEGNSVNGMLGGGLYRHTIPWDEQDGYAHTADRLARYVLSLLANDVERVFLYSMHSHDGLTGEYRPWGTLVTADGYLHPCGVAHAILAWHLEGLEPAGITDLGDGAFAYAFGGERTVLVLSSDASYAGGVVVPDDPAFTARDLWGNPLPAGAPFEGRLIYLTTGLEPAAAVAHLVP